MGALGRRGQGVDRHRKLGRGAPQGNGLRQSCRIDRKIEATRQSGRDEACRKDKGVVDEIPGAYKDIDTVMANQADLVDVMHRLKQVVCVKG